MDEGCKKLLNTCADVICASIKVSDEDSSWYEIDHIDFEEFIRTVQSFLGD